MTRNTSRRNFLRQSAAAGIGLLTGSACKSIAAGQTGKAVPKAPSIPIVDTHQHLWDFRKFHPSWLKDAPKLNHSTTMQDYYRATAGLNVVKTVYMEVDIDPRQQREEAEYVMEVCRRHDTQMAAGVVSCRTASQAF